MSPSGIWAVVPVKEFDRAKERLSGILAPALRRELARAMLEDVLEALAGVAGLGGLAVVTLDPAAGRLASRYGARLIKTSAGEGHTAAVAAAARLLAAEGKFGLATLPGDIPLATAAEIASLIEAHDRAPAFTIAPSHDEQGSNAVLLSPPDAVPLKFGENSYSPHLRAAARRGIAARVLRLPGIALDIDGPSDLARFLEIESRTRARALLAENGMFAAGVEKGGVAA
jgi:2-phospho-L-lactate guanylyltransferase